MAEEAPDALADALNAMNRANLRGFATADQWTDLVNEYFVYAEEEEGHEEEEGGETEPPEPEEDPPDPVEDEDEPLIITDPVEKILQDEWDKCENSSKYLDPLGHRLPIENAFFFVLLLKSNQMNLKLACNIAYHFWEHFA